MDISTKPKKLRVLSGPVAVVEAQLNELYDDWIFQVWNFLEVNGELVMTVVMHDAKLVRQAAMAANPGGNFRRN